MTTLITYGAALCLMSGTAAQDTSVEERFANAQFTFNAAKRMLAESDVDTVEARKQFYDAARTFAALAEEGIPSVNLYVNTGNAFHFAGDDARTLLWYLRANRLSNTAETRNGIIALRNACDTKPWPHEIGSVGRALMFWHYDLARPVKHWILLATYPLGTVMLLAAVFVRRRSMWTRLGIVLMILGATVGISDLVVTVTGDGQWAVVLEEAKGYAGDGEGYSTVVDRIAPGQEIKIVNTRKGWVHVELPSGVTCWLRAELCERV
ncbi:MAG: hypothetical protein PVI86_12540 [Phycisphaerae bacterium]|jgi:hypothetical protein